MQKGVMIMERIIPENNGQGRDQEMIEFLIESRADSEAGRTEPAVEALEELAKKHKFQNHLIDAAKVVATYADEDQTEIRTQ
jgi:hypothetical protein